MSVTDLHGANTQTMGLADRDYARSSPAQRGRGPGAGRGGGLGGIWSRHNFGMMSMNTWLIVINVAVFCIGSVLFPNVLTKQTAGRVFVADVTPEQQQRGEVVGTISRPLPNAPGFMYHPIIDPKSPLVDRLGRQVVDAQGLPVFREIGGERYRVQPLLDGWGHFSTGKAFLELQVWRFVTFQFLHANLTHLLFNMLGLWFVGWLVEEYLGRRRYLAFYLTCGIFGAVSYLALNFIGYLVKLGGVAPGLMDSIPALLFDDIYTPLVGASAGVFGVLMAAAFIAPTSIVDVFLIIPMKMRTAVYLFLAFAALNLLRVGQNAGGDAAHVGGAIAGYYFIRHMHLLRDFFDFVGAPRERTRREASAETDRILDKIRREGMASLTDAEKRELQRSTAGASGSSS